MSFGRLATIPLDHVRAELAAFPLASESGLRLCLTNLDPRLQNPTGTLWRDAERALLGSFPAFSVDECVAWRDRLWFHGQPKGPVPLAAYLRHLGELFLRVNGHLMIPRLNPAEDYQGIDPALHTPLARRSFLWMSFALPTDLLLAAGAGQNHFPERIEALSPAMQRMLEDKGYAETHLHVGAALDFPLAWVCALHAITRAEFKSDAFKAPGAGFDEGRLLGWWLMFAAITRSILAIYLADHVNRQCFPEFLSNVLYPQLAREVNLMAVLALKRIINQLLSGRLADGTNFEAARNIYIRLSKIDSRCLPDLPEDVFARDPISAFTGKDVASPEVRFVQEALAQITRPDQTKPRSGLFDQLFWQYIRIRSLVYRHIVQRPMTPGLQWFIRFYDRSKPIRRKTVTAKLNFHSAARIGGVGKGLRSLEMRTAPDSDRSGLLQYVKEAREVGGCYGKDALGRNLEWGLVFHFPKLREGGASEGRPMGHWRGSSGDPRIDLEHRSSNPLGYRFSRFYRKRREEAMSLEWLLRFLPRSLEWVRGVDVCTDELGVPNWVLAPLVERVHRAAGDGTAALRRTAGLDLPRFRTTVHAGEDFVHLLTGLRHVDEAIQAFHLNEGDRIGHGLALGVDPAAWAKRACCVPMPREDRLLDLVWEWTAYARHLAPAAPARQTFLEREISVLSQLVFRRRLAPLELEQLCHDLLDPLCLWHVGFPDRRPASSTPSGTPQDSRLRLLHDFLTDPDLFDRGREVVLVETLNEAEALSRLQTSLRRRVGAMGLTVEVNPTSNLLIGDLGDLSAHPLWRMRAPREQDDAPPVPLCIGSDDPIVFASNLRLEYQSVNDALVLAGLSSDEADAWLNQVRASGLAVRFTLSQVSGKDIVFPKNIVSPSDPMLI